MSRIWRDARAVFAALLCAIALLAAPVALAEQAETQLELRAANGAADSVRSLCFDGETLYMLGGSGVYRWTPGDGEAAERVADLSESAPYQYAAQPPEDAAEAAAWSRAVAWLFADGGALYALQPYSGQVFRVEDGGLTPAFALADERLLMEDDPTARREVRGVAAQEGKLYLLLGGASWETYDETELLCREMRTGEMSVCAAQGVCALAPAGPGELLLATNGDEPRLLLYDAEQDRAVREIACPQDAGAFAWTPRGAAALCEGRVRALEGEPQTLAYVPLFTASLSHPVACSGGGRYAAASGQRVFVRDLTDPRAAQKTELCVGGYLPPETIERFMLDNPDIAVVQRVDGDATRRAALSGDASLDVLALEAPGDYAAFAGRGYLAAIDSEGLRAFVDGLYPAVRETAVRDGALLGVPYKLSPDTWTLDATAWEETGMGDAPKTYAELFDALGRWLQDKAADYPDYALCDLQQMGVPGALWTVTRAVMLADAAPDGVYSFDDPALREALRCVLSGAALLSPDNEQWGTPMLCSYAQGFGVSYNDDHRVVQIAPLSADGSVPRMTATLGLLCVSAASGHKEEALRLLEWWAEHLDATARYELTPALCDPVERDNYASRAAELAAQREAAEKAVREAEGEDALTRAQEELARVDAMIEGNERAATRSRRRASRSIAIWPRT